MIQINKERLAEQRRMAALADEIMSNEALNGAFDMLRAAYTEGFINTLPKQSDEREKIWQAIQVLDSVRGHLRATIANGKKAADDLGRITSKKGK